MRIICNPSGLSMMSEMPARHERSKGLLDGRNQFSLPDQSESSTLQGIGTFGILHREVLKLFASFQLVHGPAGFAQRLGQSIRGTGSNEDLAQSYSSGRANRSRCSW